MTDVNTTRQEFGLPSVPSTTPSGGGYGGRTHFVDEDETQPGDLTVPEFNPEESQP